MTLKNYTIILITATLLLLSACSTQPNNDVNQDTNVSFELGQKHLSESQYQNWIVGSYEGYDNTEHTYCNPLRTRKIKI